MRSLLVGSGPAPLHTASALPQSSTRVGSGNTAKGTAMTYANRTPVAPPEAQCAFCGTTRSGDDLAILWYSDDKYALYCAHPCFIKARRIRDVARIKQDGIDSARRLGIEPGDSAHAAFPTHCGSCGAALFTGNTSGKCWRCNGGDE